MSWTRVCASQELGEGEGKEVVLSGLPIAIFRYEASLYAIDAMCAHQGGPLAKGKVADGCVTCPWHGWQYRLENGFHAATCKPMLSSFPIRESDGFIEIQIEA